MDAKNKRTLEDFMAAVPEEELTAEKPLDTFSLDEPQKHLWLQILFYLIILIIVVGVAYTGYRVYVSQNQTNNEDKIIGSGVSEDAPKPVVQYVYVDADGGLNLRSAASVTATSLVVIPDKTKLEVLAENDGWIKVEYEKNTGWLKKEFILIP